MKKRSILFMLIAFIFLLLGACGGNPQNAEDYHIDLADPSQGIYTAADLIAFFENGENNTAALGGSVDLGGEMLKLTKQRGALTLIGNGNSITSSADCVIRMEDGTELSLNDLTIIAGADGIGCLGDARLSGDKISIHALTNAVHCAGSLNVLQDSSMELRGTKGSGIIAQSISLEKNAQITAHGEQSGVHILKNDLQLSENASLHAKTSQYYCALKCSGMLRMENGSELSVENEGDYHGAELGGVEINGAVTIKADGGRRGAGLFIFNLTQEYSAAGHCEPELRLESGKGSLHFFDNVEQIPVSENTNADAEDEAQSTGTEKQDG